MNQDVVGDYGPYQLLLADGWFSMQMSDNCSSYITAGFVPG